MALTLEMKFNAENGKTLTISVNEPKENLTALEVAEAMQTIIDQNVFHNEGFPIVAIHQARIVERNVSELELQ